MSLPRDPHGDSTAALLKRGHGWATERTLALGSDAFRTRLGLLPFTVVTGTDAAAHFYGGGGFTRRGALPPTTARLLQDPRSVIGLDGAPHRHRKALWLEMCADAVGVADAVAHHWQRALPHWRRRRRIVLHPALAAILSGAARDWAGLRRDRCPRAPSVLAADLALFVDAAASLSPRTVHALLRRRATNRWAAGVIADVRACPWAYRPDSPVARLATHRDAEGVLLPADVAAVELINLLRPTVAIARYGCHAATALDRLPGWRRRIADDPALALPFAQEVRRLAPFIPAVSGRALTDGRFQGEPLHKGDRVMLAIDATNRDPAIWERPHAFRPERFRAAPEAAANIAAQGAGDPARDHRCPGEAITVAVVARLVALMAAADGWRLPPQDLTVPRSRLPTLPRSGVIVTFDAG